MVPMSSLWILLYVNYKKMKTPPTLSATSCRAFLSSILFWWSVMDSCTNLCWTSRRTAQHEGFNVLTFLNNHSAKKLKCIGVLRGKIVKW